MPLSISALFSKRAAAPNLSVPEAVEQRHSIRKFKPRALPEQDLREVLRLTGLAPSAFNAQPWRFVVVQDADLKNQLHEAAYYQAQVASAPVVIVMYTDMADTLANLDEVLHPGMPEDKRVQSKQGILNRFNTMKGPEREAWGSAQGHIALGYLVLAAQSLGYATSVMGGFDPEEVKRILELPDHVCVPALIAMGVADETGFPAHRHALERVADFR